MNAVNPLLIELIKELQALPSLSNFFLAGGTNLALKYNHRISNDIDFISNKIVGKSGYEKVIEEVTNLYGKENITVNFINLDNEEQYIFLRLFIPKGGIIVKVELLQNIQFLFDYEVHNDIKLLSKKDIGLLKLMSASNRFAVKDIYDLDYITDEVSIIELFSDLEIKTKKFNKPEHKNLFDLDEELSPLDDLSLLLKFDEATAKKHTKKPFHSEDRIDIIAGNKTWHLARLDWRLKVRRLYKHLGIEFPKQYS